jgi:hypothetical protein
MRASVSIKVSFSHPTRFVFIITDVSHTWRLFQYAYRGLQTPRRPAFYASWQYHNIKDMMEKLTNLGFACFYPDEQLESARREHLPDTAIMTGKEIEALPEYVKYFKCNGRLEKGDCDNEHKFSAPCYDQREGKVSWHPG